MTNSVQIFLANARLDDAAALTALLAPLRDGGALAKSLGMQPPGCTCAYDSVAATVRFIVNDATMVSCFSVVGITRAEAASLARACEGKSDWSLNSFQGTVSATLDGLFQPMY